MRGAGGRQGGGERASDDVDDDAARSPAARPHPSLPLGRPKLQNGQPPFRRPPFLVRVAMKVDRHSSCLPAMAKVSPVAGHATARDTNSFSTHMESEIKIEARRSMDNDSTKVPNRGREACNDPMISLLP